MLTSSLPENRKCVLLCKNRKCGVDDQENEGTACLLEMNAKMEGLEYALEQYGIKTSLDFYKRVIQNTEAAIAFASNEVDRLP